MKTVLTYGTFDLLHYGHLSLLSRARQFGDRLIVGLSTDDFNLAKGKKSHWSYEKRLEYLNMLRCVELVIPEHSWAQKEEDIARYAVDVLCMGDDWAGRFDFLSGKIEVVYLSRTQGISSSAIKRVID
jgi:glycerol-3-phosphate cytidylyltransferase